MIEPPISAGYACRALLFLDIDGVLHRRDGPWFERLPLLVAWLADHAGSCIVLSSSHREQNGLTMLREALPEALRPRLIGQTPILSRRRWAEPVRYLRQLEVEAFLRAMPDAPSRFVAIDDDQTLFSPNWPPLVLCDGRRGLTEEVLLQIESALGNGQG